MFPESKILQLSKKYMYMRHTELNAYLENIMNAPSTINRILTLYTLEYKPYTGLYYLMFGDKLILRI